MSTIHLHQTTTLTPDQYIAGLTDFGPGRAKVFSNSADDYLKVHRVGPTDADVTEGSGGVWERLHYDWSEPRPGRAHDHRLEHLGRHVGLRLHLRRARRTARPTSTWSSSARARTPRAIPRCRARERRQGRPQEVVREQRQRHRGPRQTGHRTDDSSRCRSILRGVESSAVGTLAMDTLLYRRYRGGGRQGPPSSRGSPPTAWRAGTTHRHRHSSPSGCSRRVTKREVPPRYARILNNVMHWGSGSPPARPTDCSSGRAGPSVWYGLPFGAAVWAGGYVVLPLLGVYQPIWKYDLKTLEKDLSAHLVFGTATAATFCAARRPVEVDR